MKEYNKLVRDNIPAIINKKGQKAVTKRLDDAEYRFQLERKLQEEVDEYLADKNGDELADILEVVYALGEALQLTPEMLEMLRRKKAEERGVFKDRVLLVGVEE